MKIKQLLAGGLAALTIGATLAEEKISGQFRNAVWASLIRVGVGPVIGILLLPILALTDEQARVAMIFLACPTAVASHILTDQLGGDTELSAKIVALTTIFSIVSLSVIVAIY